MVDNEFSLGFRECLELLTKRLEEPAPGRIQILAGPRQVGKTTLLLELERRFGEACLYVAADSPEASLPGYWDRLWSRSEDVARRLGRALVLIDEVHLVHDWAGRVKATWDRFRRMGVAVHIVATGSCSLRLLTGSRESLAGRFERLTLAHWSPAALVDAFGLSPEQAVEDFVRLGSYPGAVGLTRNPARWAAYVRDSILEPAIGKDILSLTVVRRPALLRQVFGVAVSSPAQIVSLQKIQGSLQDAGALETIDHYLKLLEDAFLVAALPKYSSRGLRARAAPPKLVTLNNALLAALDPSRSRTVRDDPSRWGQWVENACLAHAWNVGQRVSYWREEPLEVDGVLEGSWGSWAIEVKTGTIRLSDLKGLLEFSRRQPQFRPLVLCDPAARTTVERSGARAVSWQEYLLAGPPAP